MSHNILHDVRHAIHKIHQYDVTTSIQGEQLDIELKEAEEACSSYKRQVPELRKKRHQYDTAFEEAIEMKKMAKRNMDHKVVIISCLEKVVEKLDLEHVKQEEDALCYINATKQDPLTSIIESFNGLKIEKETELDQVRAGCIQNKERILELDESLRGLTSKEAILENMKAEAESKATIFSNVQKSKAEINLKIKENMSSKAHMSGEKQFLDDKLDDMQASYNQVKMDVLNKQDLEAQILKGMSECKDELAADIERYEASEIAYNAKLIEFKAVEDEVLELQDTLKALIEKSSELVLAEKEFSELSDLSAQLTEKNNVLKCIEQEMININDKTQTILNEQTIKEVAFEELNKRMDSIHKIEEEVERKEIEIVELETNISNVSNDNVQLIAQMQQMDITVQEYDTSMGNTENSFSNLNTEFTELEKAIEDIEELIKEVPHLEEMIRERKEKILEIENDILRLGDHENDVNSKIQEQGSMESGQIMKEIDHYDNEINKLSAHQTDLELKSIQDEESFSLKINSLKGQREAQISQAVEIRIKEIEEKLKFAQESKRKEMKDDIIRIRQLNTAKASKKEAVVSGILNNRKKANESQDSSEHEKMIAKLKPIAQEQIGKKASDSSQADVTEDTDSDSDPFGMDDSSQSDIENANNAGNKPIVPPYISKATLAGSTSSVGATTPGSGRVRKVLSTTSKPTYERKSLTTSTAKSTSQRSKDTTLQSVPKTITGLTPSVPKTPGSSRERKTLQTSRVAGTSLNDSQHMPKTPGSSRERKTLQTSRVAGTSLNDSQHIGAKKKDATSPNPTEDMSKYNGNPPTGTKTPGKREKKTLLTRRV